MRSELKRILTLDGTTEELGNMCFMCTYQRVAV
jgi:hypothetical protein